MNITVKINGQTFVVEVLDPNARPVVACIGEERFEVWPDDPVPSQPAAAVPLPPAAPRPAAPEPKPAAPVRPPVASPRSTTAVAAPLPGVIVSIAVQAGTSVTAGQELCALEAMKMKNIIRATRSGTIRRIQVAVGQTVKHKEVLMEYAE